MSQDNDHEVPLSDQRGHDTSRIPRRPLHESLLRKIESATVRVGIIGLGYVGLPLARAFGDRGIAVLGFDVDPAKVDQARARGELHRPHLRRDDPPDARAAASRRPIDFERLDEPDAIIICVPTPLTDAREPDLTYIVNSAQAIAERLRPGQLVVLESTTYPGTTRDVVLPILAAERPEAGRRLLPGLQPRARGPGQPPVLGPDDPQGRRRPRPGQPGAGRRPLRPGGRPGRARLQPGGRRGLQDPREHLPRRQHRPGQRAEDALFDRMGIDVWEVIEAAKTKPFGFQAFYPGPGLGGHCIPIDPFYLTWVARKHGLTTRFIELAGEINTSMPAYVVSKVADALNDRGKPVKGSKITLLGMAYKKDVDDPRESPGFELMELLLQKGAVVEYNDPHIPVLPPMRHYPHLRMASQELTAEYLRSRDCVLIVDRPLGLRLGLDRPARPPDRRHPQRDAGTSTAPKATIVRA